MKKVGDKRMFRKIYMFFLQKKLLKQYYDKQSEKVMKEFLKNEQF